MAARKMIAQRVYNLEPLQRNRFGAYLHMHSVSPVCPQPIRFAIFPVPYDKGPRSFAG